MLLAASAVVALLGVVVRVHDAVAFPAIYDYDASGHAVNVLDLLERHLPNVRSWCGSHPPFYYAIGAVLWMIVPDAVPVHVTLRLLSAGAWVATVALAWRALRRLGFGADAAVASAMLLGVPGLLIPSFMMTNDALCALLVTATLVRLLDAPSDESALTRHAAVTAIFAGLAALTKATGVAAIGIAVLFYAWRSRRRPARALTTVAVVGAVSGLIAAPFYAWLFSSLSGSPYDVLAARAGSLEKEAISAVVQAAAPAKRLYPSFAGLLYASIWGDPTAAFLPRAPRLPSALVSLGGMLPVAVAAAGALRGAIRRDVVGRAGIVVLFGALYLAALVPHAVHIPYIVLTKTNYLLPEALPAALLLAIGIGTLAGAGRDALRGALLVVATAGMALSWYGWWEPPVPATPPAALHAASSDPAAVTVERYFADRARDPIRALRVLAPTFHLTHQLRMARILRVPVPRDRGLSAEDERSLELARARVAWLELYNLVRWMEPIAGGLDVEVLDVEHTDATADVRARISAIGAAPPRDGEGIGLWPFPPFEQRFTLERTGDAWRITAIAQGGVVPENAVEAFVADPTLAGLDSLQALGWRPSWESAVASVLGRSR